MSSSGGLPTQADLLARPRRPRYQDLACICLLKSTGSHSRDPRMPGQDVDRRDTDWTVLHMLHGQALICMTSEASKPLYV